MARSASQAKLGYYPTPERVCVRIRSMLSFEPGATALDPCCGTGDALMRITEGAEVTRYGIELDESRMTEARNRLDHVLHGDALEDIMMQGRFDLVFLNPPYDYGDNGERLELLFLKRYLPHVRMGGMLIHIVPVYMVWNDGYAKYLRKYSRELHIYRFCDDLFWGFKQVVIFQRVGRASLDQEGLNEQIMEAVWSKRDSLEDITAMEAVEGLRFHVNASGLPIRRFESAYITPARLEALSGFDHEGFLKAVEVPQTINTVPLAPLRVGHLAMLVSSGMTNGLRVDVPDGYLVLKGTVTREAVVVRDDEDEQVTRNAPRMQVRVLWVDERAGAFRLDDLQ